MPMQPFLPGMGGAAGAHRLGRAHGVISIDTSLAERAVMRIRRVGSQMSEAFKGVRATIGNVNDEISKMRQELGAVSVAAGLLTGLGLREARSVRQYRIQFTQLLGSTEAADELIESLVNQANEFGIEFTEVLQLGRALIPVLDDGAASLDEWVTRAALLASTNPLKGATDAVRAIQEYLAGQPRSLQFLFNVDPNLIQEAQSQYEGMGEQLDFILQRMGATEEAARDMANAWVGVRNELRLVLAEGFTPLLQGMRPILTQFREFLADLRDTRPELLNVAAGLTTMTGVATTTLLMLNQVIGALQKIGKLSVAPALGKAGGIGLASLLGVGLGVTGARAIGRATGDEQLAQSQASDVWRIIKESVVVFADTFSRVMAQLAINIAAGGREVVSALASLVEGIASIVDWIANNVPGAGRLQGRAGEMREAAGRMRTEAAEFLDVFMRTMLDWQQRYTQRAVRTLFPGMAQDELGPRELRSRLSGTGGAGDTGYTEEQLSAIRQWHERRQQIHEDTEQQINDVTQQYEQQRLSTIRNFNKMMAREAEDWARQLERQQRELDRNIADVYEERAEREADWAEELAKRITDIQEAANRQLQRLQEEHRLTLMEAASRLDARAVAQEQRRYRQRRRQINDDLARRIDQEREAHQERLEEAREADEERIEDMKEAFREQRRIQEEDRRIRLQRLKEDHNEQLREMDRQHQLRVNQIRQQGYQERQQLDHEFQLQLTQLGLHQDAWLDAQERGQQASLRAFENWWDDMAAIARFRSRMNDVTFGGRQSGGPVQRTGPYMLHGTRSRPEYVLSADTTRLLQGALGGGFTQRQLLGAVAGGGGSSSTVMVQSGAINMPIYGAAGQSAADIGAEVRQQLTELFQDLLGGA